MLLRKKFHASGIFFLQSLGEEKQPPIMVSKSKLDSFNQGSLYCLHDFLDDDKSDKSKLKAKLQNKMWTE